MSGPHDSVDSSFDDFLLDEDIYEEITSAAASRVLAWQLREQIKQQGITKVERARHMGTSRFQVGPLLNSDGPV